MTRRILVTGSRDWTDRDAVFNALGEVVAEYPDEHITIVHGACPTGADEFASQYASGLYLAGGYRAEERHPADWDRYGKAAGFRRNAEMVKLGADVCLAFIRDGSRGASHTADLAEKAGVPTRRWTA